MKRYIYLIIYICLCACAQVQAQDAIVVHRKDGTVQRFPHGIYKADVRFWGSEAEGEPVQELRYGNFSTVDLGPDWQVTSYAKDSENDYAVFIAWDSTAPSDLEQYIWLGTQKGVTAENCDTVLLSLPSEGNYYNQQEINHLMILYAKGDNWGRLSWKGYNLMDSFWGMRPSDIITYPLRHGQTYYYRIAARIPALRSDGGHDTLTVFGPECSFRIPDLMAESDELPASAAIDGLVYPTSQAWEAYRTAHFTADAELPAAEAFGTMWVKWLQTPEGQALDTSAAVPHVYDDGTIRFLPAVSEAFHEWAMSREIVITDLTETIPVTITVNNQTQPRCEWSLVTTDREDWPLSLRTYIKATPITYQGTTNTDAAIDFDTRGMMPGVNYRLTVTFAPEGELPQTEENAWYFQPTRLRMGFYPDGKESELKYMDDSSGRQYFEQSGTEPTTFTFTAPSGMAPNRILRIVTAVRPPDLNSKAQINTLRVAEVRLTPVL